MYKYGETECEGMGRCHESFARVTYLFLAKYSVRRKFAERNEMIPESRRLLGQNHHDQYGIPPMI